jgi:subtilisin family serine protease
MLATFVLTSVPVPFPSTGEMQGLALVARAHSDQRVGSEIVCQLKAGYRLPSVMRRYNLQIMRYLGDNIYLMRIPSANAIERILSALKDDSDVVDAEPNYWVEVPETSQASSPFVDQASSPFVDGVSPANYFDHYAMSLIRAKDAQAITSGRGVTVAVVDTGVDTRHPVFRSVARGFDFVDFDANATEECPGMACGHGTMVAGLIALVARQATILPLRAFNSDGVGTTWQVGTAIYYAVLRGAKVINMSFGAPSDSFLIRWAIEVASRAGVVMIASAGNDGSATPQYPASDARVMAVAATDQTDHKADFSNYGTNIDVCAPGVDVYSAYPDGQFAWWSGTSFSAAFVSGEAALILSAGRGHVSSTIRRTAVDIDHLNPGYAGLLGDGRIDVLAAVSR